VTNSAIAVLRQGVVFSDLDETEIQLLAEVMQEHMFPAGETATTEGALGQGFFVVESGEAEVIVQGQRRRTITSGDCFGEIALLMGSERTATITATTDLHCYCIATSDFRTLVEANPSIAWRLYQTMVDKLS
jgi:CRP-like cAMP-binding protein